jgi:hypothetical protein
MLEKSLVAISSPVPGHDRQQQMRRMPGVVMDRVGAHLVRPIDVEEERVGDGRIAIHHLDPDAIALAEAIGDRLQRNLDLVDLPGHQRCRAGVAVLMGCAKPAFGHDERAWLQALAARLWILRELLGDLDAEIDVRLGRGGVEHQLGVAGDLHVLRQRRRREGQHAAHRIGTLRPERHDSQRPTRMRVGIVRCAAARWRRGRERAVIERGHALARAWREEERRRGRAGRRPALAGLHRAGVAHRVLDIRPRVVARWLVLQIAVVEGQEMLLVELDEREIALRRERCRRARDEQLLWPPGLLIAEDVAGAMQIHLRPDADREQRHLDLVELLGGAALLPPFVIKRMHLHVVEEIVRQVARMIAVGRIEIRHADARIEPVGEEIALDAAGIAHEAIGIVEPVIGAETGEMRRVLDAHEPLRHAVIALADAADLAVAPGLRADPFDHVIEIVLLFPVEETVIALAEAGAARVGMNIGITVLHIPLDRSGLAPEEDGRRRQIVIVVAVRTDSEQRREFTAAFRAIDATSDLHAVANGDLNVFFLNHRPLQVGYSAATG